TSTRAVQANNNTKRRKTVNRYGIGTVNCNSIAASCPAIVAIITPTTKGTQASRPAVNNAPTKPRLTFLTSNHQPNPPKLIATTNGNANNNGPSIRNS